MQLRRAVLAAFCLAANSGGAAFEVRVDISKASDATGWSTPSKALCEEWYPKINTILFGDSHPLPFAEVDIIFEPAIELRTRKIHTEIPAFTLYNAIHVSTDYLPRMTDDYHGMIIHELTHVVQNYDVKPNARWLSEGIADYIRHKYYQKDIVPKLVTDDQEIWSYRKGYQAGYTAASAFLYWLESNKNKGIVRTLNAALSERHYTPDLFKQACGAPLDRLWREFVAQSR